MPRLFLALVLACAVGCRTAGVPDFSPAAPHIKVITYNVNYGCARPAAVRDYLACSGADVICLQETNRRWQDALRALRPAYPHSYYLDSGRAGGSAILSKHPLSGVEALPNTNGWFPALTACAATPIGMVRFLNIHLHPPVTEQGQVTVAAYVSTSGVRRDEIERFMKRIDRKYPTVVLGDFNEGEDRAALGWMRANGYSNALSAFDRSTPTWSWRTKLITISKRYDHVLVDPKLKCTGARVANVGASDHEPVEAVLAKQDGND